MSEKYRASVVGASGYVGGEIIRILDRHPEIELIQATSRSYEGRGIGSVHPNLRSLELKFTGDNELDNVDILFSAAPSGVAIENIDRYQGVAGKVVDLSSDFRLNDASKYEKWYGTHDRPGLLERFEYALPEINRENLGSDLIAAGGCNATASLLALYPLREILDEEDRVVIDAKVGSSESGVGGGRSSMHSERTGVIRPYAATEHRHQAEISEKSGIETYFTAHAVEMVRGAYATIHIITEKDIGKGDLWRCFRNAYGKEPFVQFTSGSGGYRYPQPKNVAGTNNVELGFENSEERTVLFSAIDNLIKGSAGQAVQAANISLGLDETKGLRDTSLHPSGVP